MYNHIKKDGGALGKYRRLYTLPYIQRGIVNLLLRNGGILFYLAKSDAARARCKLQRTT